MMGACRKVLWIAIAGFLVFGAHALEADTLPEAWQQVEKQNYRKALELFRGISDQDLDPDLRAEAMLGEALSILQLAPENPSRMGRALQLFQSVQADYPESDAAVAAGYYEGRTHQLHMRQGNVATALAIFQRVYETYPDHFYGQLSIIQHATIRLYDEAISTPVGQVLSELEELESLITDTGAKKAFHLLMGISYVKLLEDLAAALPHYIQAEEAGIHNAVYAKDILCQVIWLAAQTGNRDVASQKMRKLETEHPLDPRIPFLKTTVEEMAGTDG